MIRVHRPPTPPPALKNRGARKTAALKAEYMRRPADYDSGAATFTFDNSVYAHPDVKSELIGIQHGKCCFCESRITHVDFGDIEHFRPKAGFRSAPEDDLQRPGYYWLAYEWANLFFCCALCNQRHKANLFPLMDESTRARNHQDDLTRESPVLVNPADEDPQKYIGFRKEIPVGLDKDGRGKRTISMLGLDRSPLNERRAERYRVVQIAFTVARADPGRNPDIPPEAIDQARRYLDSVMREDAEYFSMIQAAIRELEAQL